MRFRVPHFDLPMIGVTADDIRAILGDSKTAYFALMSHRRPFLPPVFQIPDLHSSISGAGDNALSAREIRESPDTGIMRRDYQARLRSIIVIRPMWGGACRNGTLGVGCKVGESAYLHAWRKD